MGTKVDKEDPTDLLPKVTAEKMTWRLLRDCQLDLYYKVNKPLSKDFCQWVYIANERLVNGNYFAKFASVKYSSYMCWAILTPLLEEVKCQ